MNKNEKDGKSSSTESFGSSKECTSVKSKGKSRGKKRKRCNSESSSENEDVLAENSVEVDRSLHASAIKNNLDETSVRKIIKKVVTNDRVLALVKMREEEDSGPEEDNLRPKLTRAKVKELRKVSPNTHSTTAWNLENLELTPIKHIPVKTRPEVKALIAQELPEDEDDEEYEPTHDDVPSDDDQCLESCSDLDSQPRTPATPHSQHATSPKVIKDGPFKVPQNLSTPTRRKLDLEEEATIALRTRSKLSLSATSIEHIESTFVPPDDIPMPAVDDLWNQFLNECLNPASTSKNEDDDETDPEYNVAADPDAHDEDEESLGNSIIKISKKELNDLVTELFNIIPETTEEELMADNLANSVLTTTTNNNNSQIEVSTHWEGKQEQTSDDENENGNRQNLSDRIKFEKKSYSRLSIGKSEPQDEEATIENETATPKKKANKAKTKPENKRAPPRNIVKADTVMKVQDLQVQEEEQANIEMAPPLLQEGLRKLATRTTEVVYIQVNHAEMRPEQIAILQQQLRMHVQLAASSYLQLYVHPIHWSYAPKYKEYLTAFSELTVKNPNSIVNVCNLKPAVELITTWEKTVSEDTPENQEMVRFIKNECDRSLRRGFNRNLYTGEFHETFLKVVINSPVFLYPYLLPAMPFRGDHPRRFCYLPSEDHLIAMGMEQFYQYVNDNPAIDQPAAGKRVLYLLVKHMFPMLTESALVNRLKVVRRVKDKQNPIYIYMKTGAAPPPPKHKLLPYNPQLSLYEHPEDEVPRIYTRYLAKTSSRFRNYLRRRHKTTGVPPRQGVDVQLGAAQSAPSKPPLPIQFIQPGVPQSPTPDKFDVHIRDNTQATPTNYYKFVETSTGAYLLPYNNADMATVNATEFKPIIISNNLPETLQTQQNSEHCTCCILLRKICKQRQTTITEYFGTKRERTCSCKEKRYPRVSNRLRLLVNNCKYNYKRALHELDTKIELLGLNEGDTSHNNDIDLDDVVYVTNFYQKLFTMTYSKDKKTFYRIFKDFNLDHDPLNLAKQVKKVCGIGLEDLYKEFLCFLTPEQVDKINAYKDYFRRNCVMDLIQKVEEQVADLKKRQIILMQLRNVFSKNYTGACEICTDILRALDGYPALAQYVHSLFPHRKKKSLENSIGKAPVSTPTLEPSTEKPSNENISDETNCDNTNCDNTNCDESTLVEEPIEDYEADMSVSEEEDNSGSKSPSDLENNLGFHRPIKEEINAEDVTPAEAVSLHTMVTVSKTEDDDVSDCSNSSIHLMLDDEIIKTEQPEWRRDEDKHILEIFKKQLQLTPEERQGTTLIEIVEDNNFIRMIADSLPDKSEEEIRARILYLLSHVFTENQLFTNTVSETKFTCF